MKILGLSAFHRNSAAALAVDGRIVAAIEQERFTRKRGDWSFPLRAVHQCLEQAQLTSDELDHVVFYQKPLRRFERTLISQLRAFPRSARCFSKEMFFWLGDQLWIKARMANELGLPLESIEFTTTHQAHAAAAYLPSGFESSAVLVVDGPGEWATTSLWRGAGADLELVLEQRFPHSLGLFVSALTQYLGFDPERDEAKVEALAAFGEPRYANEFDQLLRLLPDGGLEFDTRRLRLHFDADLLFDEGLVELLGPARIPGGPLELDGENRRLADIAASLQRRVGDALLHLARAAKQHVGGDSLCLGGNLALNASAMARLLEEGPFERLHLEHQAHDAGAALGAALSSAALHGDETRAALDVLALGDRPRVIPAEFGERARSFESVDALDEHVAARIADGELVGWVVGRSAWSPLGLGRRSVFAEPRDKRADRELDRRVARREPFLPLGAAVTRTCAQELFELPRGADSALECGQLCVRAREVARERTPALVQNDGTVRLHLVDERREPRLHALLEHFAQHSGVPALAEVALAARGEPPVRGAHEALEVFERSELDALVLEEHLLERGSPQERAPQPRAIEEPRAGS